MYGMGEINIYLVLATIVSAGTALVTLHLKVTATARLKGQHDEQVAFLDENTKSRLSNIEEKASDRLDSVWKEIAALHAKDTQLELAMKDLHALILKTEKEILVEIRKIVPEARPCEFFNEHERDNKTTFNRLFDKIELVHKDVAGIIGTLSGTKKE